MPDLALLNEAGHRSDGVLDRHRRVHAVLVVEIDAVDPEPPQAGLARHRHIVRLAVDAATLAIGAADVAELRGDDEPLAPARDGRADQLFVAARPIGVRGVEKGDAAVDGARDGGRRIPRHQARRSRSSCPSSRARWRRPRGRSVRGVASSCSLLHRASGPGRSIPTPALMMNHCRPSATNFESSKLWLTRPGGRSKITAKEDCPGVTPCRATRPRIRLCG